VAWLACVVTAWTALFAVSTAVLCGRTIRRERRILLSCRRWRGDTNSVRVLLLRHLQAGVTDLGTGVVLTFNGGAACFQTVHCVSDILLLDSVVPHILDVAISVGA